MGTQCVRNADGLGACQLDTETDCTLSSDCEDDFLVCRHGQCTNACESDVDCAPGARCEEDESGALGCRDAAETECMLNSDCPRPLICAPDDRCREACRTDRDCRDGTVCLTMMSPTMCGSPDLRPDAGPGDAGAVDAGAGTDGGADAGPPPGVDAGTDAGMAMGGVVPPRVGGGLGHTCAALAPDDLRCWGGNREGQLGNDSTSPITRPTPVATGLTGITVATGGAAHSCAIAGGSLYCWGLNDRGQLGLGTMGGRQLTPQMVSIPGVPTDIALGSEHTCAIADGATYCWGDNASNQISTAAAAGSVAMIPTEVSLPAATRHISTASQTTCALLTDGTVHCWGNNGNGQVGTGSTGGTVRTPFQITSLDGASQVAAGTTHSCAILGTQVLCWGQNAFGQLGDGTRSAHARPMPTTAIPEAPIQLALGSAHSCLRTATNVYCWGDNAAGAVGLDPLMLANIEVEDPSEVVGIGAVDQIATGTRHTCALEAARIRCFGENSDGQLGIGTTGLYQWTPQMVMWL